MSLRDRCYADKWGPPRETVLPRLEDVLARMELVRGQNEAVWSSMLFCTSLGAFQI